MMTYSPPLTDLAAGVEWLQGVYLHSDGRPLLGRKLAGKSAREMADLGLTVSHSGGASQTGAASQ